MTESNITAESENLKLIVNKEYGDEEIGCEGELTRPVLWTSFDIEDEQGNSIEVHLLAEEENDEGLVATPFDLLDAQEQLTLQEKLEFERKYSGEDTTFYASSEDWNNKLNHGGGEHE